MSECKSCEFNCVHYRLFSALQSCSEFCYETESKDESALVLLHFGVLQQQA